MMIELWLGLACLALMVASGWYFSRFVPPESGDTLGESAADSRSADGRD